MKQSSFDATISALDAETLSLDAETSALGAAMSAIARSYRRYRCGVYGDIGDCGVGITPQMCNRVTTHGDMSTFSKPACGVIDDPCIIVAIPEVIGGCQCLCFKIHSFLSEVSVCWSCTEKRIKM